MIGRKCILQNILFVKLEKIENPHFRIQNTLFVENAYFKIYYKPFVFPKLVVTARNKTFAQSRLIITNAKVYVWV